MSGVDERPAPTALIEAVRRWTARGRPAQPGSSWSRTSWGRTFPQYRPLFDALPDRIDRAAAAAYGHVAVDAASAEEAFVVAMIWGYGPAGYGPYRTARVLAENPGAGAQLARIAAVARGRGALAAFEHVAGRPMRYLGVAFGTKFLYFATTGADPQAAAPILDAVVCRWLSEHAGLELDIETWRPGQYRLYLDALTGWSQQLSVAPSVLEELIFREGRVARAPSSGARAGRAATSRWSRRSSPTTRAT